MLERGTGAVLHPYFHELILFLHAQLHDPSPVSRLTYYSVGVEGLLKVAGVKNLRSKSNANLTIYQSMQDLRIEACAALSLLAEHQTYEVPS